MKDVTKSASSYEINYLYTLFPKLTFWVYDLAWCSCDLLITFVDFGSSKDIIQNSSQVPYNVLAQLKPKELLHGMWI